MAKFFTVIIILFAFSVKTHADPIKAGFSSPDSICNTGCITYQDTSSGNPVAWQWTFDGGTPSNYTGQTPPQVCYSTPGAYQTQLIVTDSFGNNDTISKIITVTDCRPVGAGFSSPDSICNTGCITYQDTSSGNPVAWQWTFDGGTPSNYTGQTPPQVCYSTPGAYQTQLIVTDSFGNNDTISKIITVTDCRPVGAGFSSPDSICNTGCITYQDTSSGNPVAWQWTFDGGTPSNYTGQTPPQVCYSTPGAYQTQLIVTDSFGNSDTVPKTITVTDCRPVATFTVSKDTICSGSCVTLVSTCTNATSTHWLCFGATSFFGNGPTPAPFCYSDSGHFLLKMIVQNNYGIDTAVATLIVRGCLYPTADFSAATDTVCALNCIPYTNLSSANATFWQWSFPGAKPSSYTGKNPPPVCYDSIGTYFTKLLVSNNHGSDSITKALVVTDCHTLASFNMSDTAVCRNGCIALANTSAPGATSYQWFFQGGSPSSYSGVTPPQVCYSNTGNFTVQLRANSNFGTISANRTIQVSNCIPSASFSANDTSLCMNSCAGFNNLSTNADSWHWNFYGGNPSSYDGPNPPMICYDSSGSYDVSLIATNSYGADTANKRHYIEINSPPHIHIGQDGDTLECTHAETYQWFYGQQTITGATDRQYIASLSGTYAVTAADNSDCTGTDSLYFINTGVNNTTINDEFIISPNPNAGVFTVTFANNVPEGIIEVRNILGEIIDARLPPDGRAGKTQDARLTDGQARLITIDLSPQANGIYFVRLQTASGIKERKVIINR